MGSQYTKIAANKEVSDENQMNTCSKCAVISKITMGMFLGRQLQECFKLAGEMGGG